MKEYLINITQDKITESISKPLTPEEIKLRFNRLFVRQWGLHNAEHDEGYGIDVDFYKVSLMRLFHWAKYEKAAVVTPPIALGFTNRTDIAASVTKDDGIYYVGINLVVVCLLDRLFNTMLSNSKVLTVLGNASDEEHEERVSRHLFKDIANF